MVRVAYVCGNPSYSLKAPSGYAVHINAVANGLRAHGMETTVWLPSVLKPVSSSTNSPQNHRLKKYISPLLWEALKDARRLWSDRSFRKKLVQQPAIENIDLIYERLDFSGAIMARWAFTHHIPYVLEIHAPLDDEATYLSGKRPFAGIFRRRIKNALSRAQKIVVVSGEIKKWVASQGISADRIIIVPNGVDLDFFNPEQIHASDAARLPSDSLIVGYVGSSLGWHKLEELLKGFSVARKEVPMRLVLVGIAASDPMIRSLAKSLQIENDLLFTGPLSHGEIPATIQGFDVCVMAGSNSYGSPIKLFEYGAMGKAIVAPDTAPIREVMVDGVDGVLIPSGDCQALARALIKLARDPDLRMKLGKTFQNKVRSKYGWLHATRHIADAFEELIH